MNEIDQIEQDLLELKQRFTQSADVLEELSQIKAQFSDLSQSRQALEASLAKADQLFNQSPEQLQSVETKFAQVEQQFESRYEQLQAQLTSFRFDFDAINRQLHEKIEQDRQGITRLEEVHEQALANLGVDDADRLKWIESSLQHFNASIYNDRTALQKLERRYTDLKRLVNIMAVVGGVAIAFLILSRLFLPR